jgi:hypothetical protein
VNGGHGWWQRLPDRIRITLLVSVAPDDWQRFERCAWGALPDGLKSAISSESRAMQRALQGCPWR